MTPARKSSLCEITSASAGSSRRVGMKYRDHRIIPPFSPSEPLKANLCNLWMDRLPSRLLFNTTNEGLQMDRNAPLAEVDPVIAGAIDNEVARQANGLELI